MTSTRDEVTRRDGYAPHERTPDSGRAGENEGPAAPACGTPVGPDTNPTPGPAVAAVQRAFGVRAVAVVGGLVALVAAVLLSAAVGAAGLPVGATLRTLADQLPGVNLPDVLGDTQQQLLWHIRLPRTALAVLVGGALATAGAAYQGVFRNPLADPYLLGVSAGAGVGAILALGFGLDLSVGPFEAVPAAAFLGAITAVTASAVIARGSFKDPSTLLLAGVAVAALFSAVQTYLLQQLEQTRSREVLSWMFGRLATDGWAPVLTALPYVLVSGAVLAVYGRKLDVMRLGDEEARSLGVDAPRVRLVVIVAATLMTSAAVSVSGLIGFVGLVIPHVVRLLAGYSYRVLLPLAGLYGGTFLLFVDVGARTLVAPAELPIGVITAFVGAPFFGYILWRRRAGTGRLRALLHRGREPEPAEVRQPASDRFTPSATGPESAAGYTAGGNESTVDQVVNPTTAAVQQARTDRNPAGASPHHPHRLPLDPEDHGQKATAYANRAGSPQAAVVLPLRAAEAELFPALAVCGLRVHLGSGVARKEIVRGVDVQLGCGEMLALIGPNGSGKSTLMRAVAGLLPSEGRVEKGFVGSSEHSLPGGDARTPRKARSQPGGEPSRTAPGPRDLALLPQHPVLPEGMTVAEYVLLGRTPHLGAWGRESNADRVAVVRVLERLDLVRYADRPVTQLSGGETQRVTLARALAQQAPVLLLDEPTSALDIGAAAHVLDLVEELRRTDGLSVLVAIHDLSVAARYADRLVLLSNGEVAATGTATEVLIPETLSRVYRAPLRVHEVDGQLVVLRA